MSEPGCQAPLQVINLAAVEAVRLTTTEKR